MNVLFLEAGVGYLIGLILGLLGGGGSILTVPALVYLIGQTPQVAVTASLVIVGTNSAIGALFHRAQGNLNWRVALTFGGSGMLTAYLAAGLSRLFSPVLLLILFSVLMLVIGIVMLVRPAVANQLDHAAQRRWSVVIFTGAAVGMLTGFLGVGGGFLIVPALVMLVGLPMQQAVGTSLVIIAMNSAAGLLGHLGESTLDPTLLLIFIASGLLGTFCGTRLTQRFKSQALQRAFALFILMLATLLLIDNLSKL
jgi:uncharacterized protein